MTEETRIVCSIEFILIFLHPKVKILLKIRNEIYKYTKQCNIMGPGNDKDTFSELWSPDIAQKANAQSTIVKRHLNNIF